MRRLGTSAIKAIVFDLDGTLLDTLADLADAVNHVLGDYGHPVHETEWYREKIGGGVQHLLWVSLPEEQRAADKVQEAVHKMSAYYRDHWHRKTKLYAGIADMLEQLKKQGMPLAILSNKQDPFTQDMVQHFFPQPLFEVVQGAVPQWPHKPDPGLALDVVRRLGYSASDVAYVGDTEVDMETARRAGFTGLGVLWGFRSEETLKKAGAAYLLRQPGDLFSCL